MGIEGGDSRRGLPLRGRHLGPAMAYADRSAAAFEVQNIAIILALLLVPYVALMPLQVTEPIRARIGILAVFLFTSIGQFSKVVSLCGYRKT